MRFLIAAVIFFILPVSIVEGASYKRPEIKILMEKATAYSKAMEYDSAMNIYRDVVTHYNPKMNDIDKRLCLDAVYGCFDINIKNGFYSGAVNDLALAEDINEDLGLESASLHARYAQLYVVMLSQTGKEKYIKMIEDHAHKAFQLGIEEGDFNSASKGFSNLLIAYYTQKDPGVVEKEIALLRNLNITDWKLKALLLDYEHMKASLEGNYDRAVVYLDSLLNIIPNISDTYRMRLSTMRDKAIALGYGGHQREAIEELNKVIDLSYKNNLRDQRLAALNACSLFSENMGDSVAMKGYESRALALKDSLSAYNIGDEIVELEYLKERKELHKNIDRARSDRKLMFSGLIGLSVILLTILVFLVVLKKKNSVLAYRGVLLRKRMQELYSRNQRIIQEREASRSQDSAGPKDNPKASETAGTKYESSSLAEEEKKLIAREIEQATAGDMVFNPDFSLQMLADTIHRHPKVVSQVINEVFSVNFPTYINRIRIVEACRMFDNPQYANWSVEGIAEAVGIKSRSSFSSNFKKITGMNIKEYRKKTPQQES